MKKLMKVLAFIAVAGAAVAGFWYFLFRTENDETIQCGEKSDDEEAQEEIKREYVSLDTSIEAATEAFSAAKETMKKNVKEVAENLKKKAEEKAENLGIVKCEEEKAASEFEFQAFESEETAKNE